MRPSPGAPREPRFRERVHRRLVVPDVVEVGNAPILSSVPRRNKAYVATPVRSSGSTPAVGKPVYAYRSSTAATRVLRCATERRQSGFSDAVEPGWISRAWPRTPCSSAVRSTSRRIPRPLPHRGLQDGGEHVHGNGVHRGAPEMDASLNADLYEQVVQGIADTRKKSEAEVRALLDGGPFLPEDALPRRLIDDVAYEDQVDVKLRAGDDRPRVDGDEYARISASSLGLNRGPQLR